MMWAAGVLASVSSITYPAISAFVSMHSDADKQGNQRARPAQHVFACIVTDFVYKVFSVCMNQEIEIKHLEAPDLPYKVFYCDNCKFRTWHLPYIIHVACE